MPVYKMPVLTLRRTGVLLSRNLKDPVRNVQGLFLFETANAMSHWGIFNKYCLLYNKRHCTNYIVRLGDSQTKCRENLARSDD